MGAGVAIYVGRGDMVGVSVTEGVPVSHTDGEDVGTTVG